jgi:hypothetical protein
MLEIRSGTPVLLRVEVSVGFVGCKTKQELDKIALKRRNIRIFKGPLNFAFMWPRWIVTNFFITKPTRCTNFTNLFCHETLYVSDSSCVHHQEFIHCTLSNGICHTGTVHTAFEQDQDGIAVPFGSYSKACVQWINSCWWRDELSETFRVCDKINLSKWCI